MKVIIDRRKWNTGERLSHPSRLFDENSGSLCCLGFLGEACGAKREHLEGINYPGGAREFATWPPQLFAETPAGLLVASGLSSTWETVLAHINDADHVDDATREAWIAEGFKTVLGVEVEFVGDYGDGT